MIDIIIPAYNAKETICQTLLSINMQTIKELCKIYIINDGSNDDYSNEISMFKGRIDITEIKLTENSGPGIARQVGINASNSEYIIFIDSDDEFYDCYSLENIFQVIEKGNYDMVTSNMLEIENDNSYEYMSEFNVLHSKIYRRKYIKDNGICFPNLYHSEDISFNDLCMIFNPKIGYCEKLVYVYKRRENSLTFNDYYFLDQHIKYYVESKVWTINKAKEYNAEACEIAKIVISSFAYLYYYFCNNMSDDTIKYIYCFVSYYNEYAVFLSEAERLELIYLWIERLSKYPLNVSFEDFKYICEKNYSLNNNI